MSWSFCFGGADFFFVSFSGLVFALLDLVMEGRRIVSGLIRESPPSKTTQAPLPLSTWTHRKRSTTSSYQSYQANVSREFPLPSRKRK